MMKKSLCCALLLTASFSTFAAAKTEQQIADIVNRTITPLMQEQAHNITSGVWRAAE